MSKSVLPCRTAIAGIRLVVRESIDPISSSEVFHKYRAAGAGRAVVVELHGAEAAACQRRQYHILNPDRAAAVGRRGIAVEHRIGHGERAGDYVDATALLRGVAFERRAADRRGRRVDTATEIGRRVALDRAAGQYQAAVGANAAAVSARRRIRMVNTSALVIVSVPVTRIPPPG